MVHRGHVPRRMCAGCGRRASRHELVRLCAVDGERGRLLAIDVSGKTAGRGGWLCPRTECLEAALKRDSLGRRLHAKVDADSLRQDFMDHITGQERTDGEEKSI